MVDGVLYVSTSLSQVAALDAATGKAKWLYDPETWKNGTPSNNGFVHRGVAYWADGKHQRVLFGTGDGYLICLDAQTGRPISSFGQNGRIDLTQGLGRSVNRRRELGGCGVRSRDRADVRPIDHEPIGGHDRESGATVASAVCRNRCADGNPAGGAPVETTLRTRHGHRSQHGQSPVDGAVGRDRPSAVAGARSFAPGAGHARAHAVDEDIAHHRTGGHHAARGRRHCSGTGLRDSRRQSDCFRQDHGGGCGAGGAATQRHGSADDLHAER